MAGVLQWYNDLFDKHGDPRVKDWSMTSGPMPTLCICLMYAYSSKVLGPKLMENRKPFTLRNILIYYNAFQTLFSAWIFYEYMMSGWGTHYSLRCQPVDYSNDPTAMRMAKTCWWYYISKFTEFFDTLFFILRKKHSQVSTLHVIHHGIMPMSVWMGLKFAPGGHSTFFALLNTFVHIVMYFYYMVSAMGPKYQKYIWWKKYLTTFQMVQFVFIFAHQFQLLFTECDYPKGFMVWIAMHGVLFLVLFSNFYREQYVKSGQNKIKNEVPLSNGKVMNGSIKSNGYSVNSKGASSYTNGHAESKYNDVYYSNCIKNGFTPTNDGHSDGHPKQE